MYDHFYILNRFDNIVWVKHATFHQSEVLVIQMLTDVSNLTGGQIIEYRHFVLWNDPVNQVASNESEASGDKDSFHCLSALRNKFPSLKMIPRFGKPRNTSGWISLRSRMERRSLRGLILQDRTGATGLRNRVLIEGERPPSIAIRK